MYLLSFLMTRSIPFCPSWSFTIKCTSATESSTRAAFSGPPPSLHLRTITLSRESGVFCSALSLRQNYHDISLQSILQPTRELVLVPRSIMQDYLCTGEGPMRFCRELHVDGAKKARLAVGCGYYCVGDKQLMPEVYWCEYLTTPSFSAMSPAKPLSQQQRTPH
jgi:hypothetical protein